MQDSLIPAGPKGNKTVIILLIGGALLMATAAGVILKRNSTPEKKEEPPKVEMATPTAELVANQPKPKPLEARDTGAPVVVDTETDTKKENGKRKRDRLVPMGKLDPKEVNSFINARFSQVKACYERRLKTNAFLEGKVDLNINISPSGKVTAIAVNKDSVGDAEMLSCVKRTIRGWNFPKPDGGRVVIAKTFNFKKKG